VKRKELTGILGCFALLLFATVAWAAPVPDTGQTKCYDVAGNAMITCPSKGQELQEGSKVTGTGSFSNNSLPHEDAIEDSVSATLTSHVMCYYPLQGLINCNPPTKVTSFNPGDYVMNWVSSTGVMQIGDTITWNWYSPNGFYGSFTFTYPTTYSNACAGSWVLGIGIPGTWHIDVIFNGNYMYTDYFIVSNLMPPAPGIKANGHDSELWVDPGTPVSITVSLATGDQNGKLADWWVVVTDMHYVYSWTLSGWFPGICQLFQYPLVAFSPEEILNEVLPEGGYVFYFGVDMSPNGILDSQLFFDSVKVYVVKSTPVLN
jgi:hypothetical protein